MIERSLAFFKKEFGVAPPMPQPPEDGRPGLIARLVQRGARVIAPDMRGFGKSDRPRETTAYADSAMARDMMALVRHLGLTSVDVVACPDGPITDLYWSNRVYLMTAFGKFCIHPYCRELATREFIDGVEIMFYHNRKEMFGMIDWAVEKKLARTLESAAQSMTRTVSALELAAAFWYGPASLVNEETKGVVPVKLSCML